jgi:hypothetical protein
MKKIIFLIYSILLIFIGFYAYNVYRDLPLNRQELTINFRQDLPIPENTSSTLKQFSPNMRFNTNNLSYYFQQGCTNERKEQMKLAFLKISKETKIIYFYELHSLYKEPEIIISCSEESKRSLDEENNKKTFIAGEGGPTKFLNLLPYPLIIQGEIELYSSKYATQCSEPLVELHELLHVFGYDHISEKDSILYPYLSCDQKFKQAIIDNLIGLYSEPARAELSINNISASKAGKYLDFFIEIKNTGLIDAENVIIEVSTDNRLIKDFELEDLSPGLTRSLKLTNLELPSNKVNNLNFSVKSITPEYYLENNLIEMQVSG